jgi:cephalosporin hydroxylase
MTNLSLKSGDVPSPVSSLPLEALRFLQAGIMKYTYKGIPTLKSPLDLALYSKLLWETKPRTIIEIGSRFGGSAMWLADQARTFSLDAHVYSLDINLLEIPIEDPDISFRQADANDLDRYFSRAEVISLPHPLLVIEDSSHQASTTLSVLEHFRPVMEIGEFIVIEDGIVTSLGWADKFNGGPAEGVRLFIEKHGNSWMIDRTYCDFFGRNATWNPNGYLRRVK